MLERHLGFGVSVFLRFRGYGVGGFISGLGLIEASVYSVCAGKRHAWVVVV